MTKELETLLTELYVLIDDRVVPPRRGRGRRPELTDSELLCLAVAQMLLGFHSERRWMRYAHGNAAVRAMFPYLPRQSGYHKRLKAAQALLCNTIRVLARDCPSWSDDLWITDATPVRVEPPAKRSNARIWPGTPDTDTAPATPATTGA